MKLIFFDIDGTLIEGRGKRPQSAADAVRKAQENGHLCLVNTGRTACLVTSWLPEFIPFDGYICGCGTHILFQGEELLHQTFTREEALEILVGLERYRIDAILEGAKNDYHNAPDRMHTEVFRNYIAKISPGKGWGSYREAPGNFDKFFCYAENPDAVKSFVAEKANLLELIDREGGFYEVVPRGFSKASGMDFLIEYLNAAGRYGEKITLENTVAIGDSGNDLPMLRHAHTAIAMGGSTREVMEEAHFVTGRVMENGIATALDWLGVLKNSGK